MLRVSVTGLLLRDPEDRPQHGDVLASLLVRNATSGDLLLRVYVRADTDPTRQALRALRRGDVCTILGAGYLIEVAGLPPPRCAKYALQLHADTVLAIEPVRPVLAANRLPGFS